MRLLEMRGATATAGMLGVWLGGLAMVGPGAPAAAANAQPGTGTAQSTYTGRAFGASVIAPGVGTVFLSDSRQLPPYGGFRSRTLPTTRGTPVESVLLADALVASTSAGDCHADSSASLTELAILPGHAAMVTASFVRAEAHAVCIGVGASAEIANLTFGGQSIPVSGAPNQTVSIPGVATLIINEQRDESTTAVHAITVNGLHLIVPGVADVVVASARSEMVCASPCGPWPCHDFVTGGGWVAAGDDRADFGFSVGFTANSTPVVQFSYIDRGMGMVVRATTVTVYQAESTAPGRRFEGACEVNGVPGFTYSVEVADNGDPGRGSDTLQISLSNGYSAGGALQGGNIQLFDPCD